MANISSSSVLTLVVTYNGAETIGRLFRSLSIDGRNSTRPILIIDNASEDHTIDAVRSLKLPNLELVALSKNIGVARAYNMGLGRAVESGMDWLFILDQDSQCGPFLLDRLQTTAHDLRLRTESVAAVCPKAKSRSFPGEIHYPWRWNGYKFNILINYRYLNHDPLCIDSTISSGTLYRVEALSDIDGFCEDYFIDFVDHDCHMRLRQNGWSLWWEQRAELFHELGKIQKMTAEGLWIEHEPYRYYYMARNMFHAYGRFGGLKSLCALTGDVLRHMLRLRRYGTSPNKSMLFIIKGIKDAVSGKFGPLDSDD